MAPTQVNLYEAKTQLSRLVERAAKGEEIVIAKAGKQMARLTAILETNPVKDQEPLPFGKNLLGVKIIAEDWESDLSLEQFEDATADSRLFSRGS